ncbi:ATPase family AAA domain-containing protein 3B [Diplodia seriata]|uniref:ATPase family AAA domain-containing protein 3B n=1 Tax=Diplodia seriata TaxID=420778 RepID=A0A1S8BN88_9PEZI|nr:ATPase family AAA domain-containing protein 3B [Diplodia seriata]
MAQSDAGLPEAIDQPSEDENAKPVASGPHHDDTCSHGDDGTHAKESQEPADSSPDISEEIQAVKMKILELEQSARKLPVSRDSEAQLLDVTEQHRRMEACLYKHRKEWETTIGPGYWSLQPDVMKTTRTLTPYGPWNRHWRIESKNDYVRPNPFDPSHQCAVDPDDIEASVIDGFDRTIDYGARRDRARKAFEWEMDRLYLAEEIEMKRRKGGVRPPEPLKPYGPISEDTESRINRLEWFSFKQMGEVGRPGGCVVEVLEGEPIVDDGVGGYHRWYATSGRRDRKAKGIQDHKAFDSMPSGQAPLPERIRIRSNALLRIISTILGEAQPPYTSSTVMIRPFKMLIVCERELREWYAALERKFSADASMRKGSTNFAIGPDSIRSPEAFKRRQGEKGTLTAFDRLVLEKGHRDMIVSLVSQHFRDKESRTGKREDFDIVQGKGKGLILLLHGAPGVGKTSTAGDLGTTAKEVEKALETNFALASKWDCILLLDEADVFLAQRTKEDFKRNGLVAAFLRVMEYYTGILFLTTNRVGDFDEAFTSRIHISLYYPELNEEKTVEVFTINMNMIQKRFNDSGRTIKIDRVAIGGFATGHFAKYDYARWNGRQIRNACQTALALAEFEAQGSSHTAILKPDAVVELEKRHFEIVRDAYLEFTKYMDDIYGTNPTRRAKEAHLRAMRLAETVRVSGGSMGVDSKAAFARASQAQPQHPPQLYQQMPYSHHSQSVPSQGIRLQPQQPQPYNQYQNFNVQQPNYPETDHMRMQQQNQPDHQYWSNPGTSSMYASPDGPREGQNQAYAPHQPPPPPILTQQHQQQQQQNPTWLGSRIQDLYAASGPQSAGQGPSGGLPTGRGDYTSETPT